LPDRPPSIPLRVGRTLHRSAARGPGEVLRLAAQRLREAWHSENELILNVRRAVHVKSPAEGLTFREARPSDGARYARDIGTDTEKSFQARLAPDVRCFLAEDDERILHSSWVTTTGAWTREIRAYLRPPEGDAYVYESFTRADARGRGIYPFALAGILTALAEDGIANVWVGVEADNIASRKSIAKAGFEETFTLRFERRLGRLTVDEPRGPRAEQARHFVQARL
jgi:RimJ/RimL family protein N-acetyltransferase